MASPCAKHGYTYECAKCVKKKYIDMFAAQSADTTLLQSELTKAREQHAAAMDEMQGLVDGLGEELEQAQAALRDLWKFRGHVDEPVTRKWFLDDNPEHRAAIEKAMSEET